MVYGTLTFYLYDLSDDLKKVKSVDTLRKKIQKNIGKLFKGVLLAACLFVFTRNDNSLYDQAFAILMENEGGYVNHPSDPGGETKYGICKKYNPEIDIKNITLDFAKEYYYKKFWRSMYERIKDQRISVKLFDTSVHIGLERLRELVNETLEDALCYPNPLLLSELNTAIEAYKFNNDLPYWEDYVVDKINSMDSEFFLNVFKSKLVNYYCDRIYGNNKLSVFRLGWIKRAMK